MGRVQEAINTRAAELAANPIVALQRAEITPIIGFSNIIAKVRDNLFLAASLPVVIASIPLERLPTVARMRRELMHPTRRKRWGSSYEHFAAGNLFRGLAIGVLDTASVTLQSTGLGTVIGLYFGQPLVGALGGATYGLANAGGETIGGFLDFARSRGILPVNRVEGKMATERLAIAHAVSPLRRDR